VASVFVFQFQFGAIKSVKEKDQIKQIIPYFNSNLVRLKDKNYKIMTTGYVKFQFQFGAIKRK